MFSNQITLGRGEMLIQQSVVDDRVFKGEPLFHAASIFGCRTIRKNVSI